MAFFLTAPLPEAQNDFFLAFLGSPWGLLAGYLLVINLIAFLIFGVDKWKARRKKTHESTRRVPEKTLFLLAALGGSLGALLGMKAFHHKTLHNTFTIGIPLILILQIVIPLGLFVYFRFLR